MTLSLPVEEGCDDVDDEWRACGLDEGDGGAGVGASGEGIGFLAFIEDEDELFLLGEGAVLRLDLEAGFACP